jgi:serine/threonine protein kinase
LRASKPHTSDALAPGQRIGPFVLLSPLGVGGSGRVWAVARFGQLGFSKRMALKVIRHDKVASARTRERFDREACLVGRLNHPNVRAVHDLGSDEGRPFMAMSWVDTSLEELLEHAPGRSLEAEVVCWIGMQCCSALSAAHEFVDPAGKPHPIVHHDVSPGNVLLTADGHALLADLTAPVTTTASPRGEAGARFFGSLGYAAPEALRQEAQDGRADLFSLGAVLYEALAGAPAFEGDDERQVMFQVLEGKPVELARRAPGISPDLAAVVQRCLESSRERRFQSAAELRAALSECCRHLSAFRLEQRTAAVVREVLGARIREKEEAIYLAFQRHAPSAFEHTDTLPLVSTDASAQRDISTIALVTPTDDVDHHESQLGAGMARGRRKPARRSVFWILAISAGCSAAYALWSGHSTPTAGSATSSDAPGSIHGTATALDVAPAAERAASAAGGSAALDGAASATTVVESAASAKPPSPVQAPEKPRPPPEPRTVRQRPSAATSRETPSEAGQKPATSAKDEALGNAIRYDRNNPYETANTEHSIRTQR